MFRLAIIGLVSVLCALLMAVTYAPHASAGPLVCDRTSIMNQRLDQLGRHGYVWSYGTTSSNTWGMAMWPGKHDVTVSVLAPCSYLVSIINHEWGHTRQNDRYPGRIHRTYGAESEFVADCVSKLLGSKYTPYLDQRQREECIVGCTPFEVNEAKSLI